MQPYATGSVSLGSADEPYGPDMDHSYQLTEVRLIRYPMIQLSSAQSLSKSSSNSLGSKVDHDSIISRSRRIASFLFF